MTSRSIAVVTTGGTIAMRYDVAAGGNVPALNGRELLDHLGPLPSEVTLRLEEWEQLPAITRWLSEGKPVVLASQCPEGTVGADYAFEGGGRQVLGLGVIPAGSRTAAQARLELALCLSAGVPYGTGTAG